MDYCTGKTKDKCLNLCLHHLWQDTAKDNIELRVTQKNSCSERCKLGGRDTRHFGFIVVGPSSIYLRIPLNAALSTCRGSN